MEGERSFVTISLDITKGSTAAGKTSAKQQWARHLGSRETLALAVAVTTPGISTGSNSARESTKC